MRTDIYIPKAKAYEEFLELKVHENWWSFTSREFSKTSIFRGHSNYHKHSIKQIVQLNTEREKARKNNSFDERLPNKDHFSIWETKSSFHRQFQDCEFWMYYQNYKNLIQHIDLYKNHLKSFLHGFDVKKLSVLQILQLFQHYGIPTPLIDFTKDPDTAFYFAYSDLFDQGVRSNIESDCGNRFVTIIELKVGLLMDKSIITSINDDYFKDRFELKYEQFYYYEPTSKINNGNIDLQDGVFIYLDSEMSIEDYLFEKKMNSPSIIFDEKPIIWHIIPYSSLDFNREHREKFSAFAYLLYKNKLGCYLFNDIRGIERDMKNSNIKFKCIQNREQCDCLKNLLNSHVLK